MSAAGGALGHGKGKALPWGWTLPRSFQFLVPVWGPSSTRCLGCWLWTRAGAVTGLLQEGNALGQRSQEGTGFLLGLGPRLVMPGGLPFHG